MREKKERKSKGSLSVLDEFTSDSGAGEIVYAPKANPEVLKKIEEATRLADVPISSRSISEKREHCRGNLMSKKKTSTDDFLKLLDDEENSSQPIAFAPKIDKKEITNPLDSRETGVSSALDKPLDSRETGVSSALEKIGLKKLGVSSALDKPLDSRETGVRKIENSALDISTLVGKEKMLVNFIALECKKIGELETNFLSIEELKSLVSLDSLGLRNLIFRVKEKKFFTVTAKQLGRVGLRKFKISRQIYQQVVNLALDSRETGVSSALDKPLDKPLDDVPYSSSNYIYNTTTIRQPNNSAEIQLPTNLAKFGISKNNLQKLISEGVSSFEIIQKSIEALSFDVENGRTGNLAAILFGVLRAGKEYISQKQAEEISKELDFELKRLKAIEEHQKELAEMRLKAHYEEFLKNSPGYLDEIKKRHSGLLSASSGLLDKIAFEEFKTNLENKQGDI